MVLDSVLKWVYEQLMKEFPRERCYVREDLRESVVIIMVGNQKASIPVVPGLNLKISHEAALEFRQRVVETIGYMVERVRPKGAVRRRRFRSKQRSIRAARAVVMIARGRY